MSDTMRMLSAQGSNPSIMTPRLEGPNALPAALLEQYRLMHNQAAAAAAASGGMPGNGPHGLPPMPFFPGAFAPPPDMKPEGLHLGGNAQPLPGYYYDPMMAAATCPYGGAPLDLNGARRKNATRETTAALKAWLYEHRKNPYPTKGEKVMLAIITKMTLTQVSTWFANARRRLKKENKMTWSPRNRPGEDDDLGAPLDDSDGRPLSGMSDLSDEPHRPNDSKPSDSLLQPTPAMLTAQNLAAHQHLMAQQVAAVAAADRKRTLTDASLNSPSASADTASMVKKPKIWSIADTVAGTTQSSDKSPEQASNTTTTTTTESSPQSSSQPVLNALQQQHQQQQHQKLPPQLSQQQQIQQQLLQQHQQHQQQLQQQLQQQHQQQQQQHQQQQQQQQQQQSTTTTSTTAATPTSTSQPYHFTFNPWQQHMAALYAARPQLPHGLRPEMLMGRAGMPPVSMPAMYPQFNAALLAQLAASTAGAQSMNILNGITVTASPTIVTSSTANHQTGATDLSKTPQRDGSTPLAVQKASTTVPASSSTPSSHAPSTSPQTTDTTNQVPKSEPQ